MFESKKTSLFEVPKTATSGAEQRRQNRFLSGAGRISAETRSGNGALKYRTTGNPFVDQFGALSDFKQPRPYTEIAADCETLYNLNREDAIKFIFYLRMITRTVSLPDGSTTSEPQKGAELKHEAIMRMIWLHLKEPEVFWNNIGLFVAAGSWKDVFVMLRYDLMYNGWEKRELNWNQFGDLIMSGMSNPNSSELISKYLPQIRAKSKCKTVEAQANTIIGKWLASLFFGSKDDKGHPIYKSYRQMKSSGTAHQWQQLISQQRFNEIDFSKIHGRALNLLVKGKFLANHNLTHTFETFAKEATSIKYTGFAHEAMHMCTRYRALTTMPAHERETVDKQFMELVNRAGGGDQTKLIVVRDTSGSMSAKAIGTNMNCYNVAKAIALYFSYFLTGEFQDAWIEFHSTATMRKWQGNTPTERWFGDRSNYVGGTKFQSVIDLFVRLKQQGVPESEFPEGILCISDGMFNPTELGRTNVDTARAKLVAAGFSQEYTNNFVIVLWNLVNNFYGRNMGGKQFETYGNAPNTFYFSGYSPAVVSFLTENIETPEELFKAALNQELINLVKF